MVVFKARRLRRAVFSEKIHFGLKTPSFDRTRMGLESSGNKFLKFWDKTLLRKRASKSHEHSNTQNKSCPVTGSRCTLVQSILGTKVFFSTRRLVGRLSCYVSINTEGKNCTHFGEIEARLENCRGSFVFQRILFTT